MITDKKIAADARKQRLAATLRVTETNAPKTPAPQPEPIVLRAKLTNRRRAAIATAKA